MHDIVACGGNSLPKGTLTPLHRYMLALTGVHAPNVCFVPTASGDAQEAIEGFYQAFSGKAGELTHLTLFANTTRDVEALMVQQHLILVGGGNTRNMLLLWRAWGVDAAIRTAWNNGTVIGGSSAGALCWFESGLTDSYAGEYRELACLGWAPGSFCPHYDSEHLRQPVLAKLVGDGTIPAGYAVEDDAAVHLRDGAAPEIVAQIAGKSAYAVRAENGAMQRERLEARLVR